MYSSEFVECLLEQNWGETRRVLIIRYFSVYIIYVVCSILYMKRALAPNKDID